MNSFKVLLAFIDLKNENARLRAAIRKVLAMHQPMSVDALEILKGALQ